MLLRVLSFAYLFSVFLFLFSLVSSSIFPVVPDARANVSTAVLRLQLSFRPEHYHLSVKTLRSCTHDCTSQSKILFPIGKNSSFFNFHFNLTRLTVVSVNDIHFPLLSRDKHQQSIKSPTLYIYILYRIGLMTRALVSLFFSTSPSPLTRLRSFH